MNLKISLKSQLKALKELIIVTFVYCIFLYFLYEKVEFDLFKMLFLSTGCFYLLIIFLPVILLHVNYLSKNNYKEIFIDKNKLILDDNIYCSKDIDIINIFATNQHFNSSVGAYSFAFNDFYYYIEIQLNNKEKIILSSLINYKIDEILMANFPQIKIVKKTSTFFSLFI